MTLISILSILFLFILFVNLKNNCLLEDDFDELPQRTALGNSLVHPSDFLILKKKLTLSSTYPRHGDLEITINICATIITSIIMVIITNISIVIIIIITITIIIIFTNSLPQHPPVPLLPRSSPWTALPP